MLLINIESFLFESRKYQGINQSQNKTSAEKESGKILPEDREAAGTPKPTRSFNRDTHAKAFHHET
jgi:hypothetical protein